MKNGIILGVSLHQNLYISVIAAPPKHWLFACSKAPESLFQNCWRTPWPQGIRTCRREGKKTKKNTHWCLYNEFYWGSLEKSPSYLAVLHSFGRFFGQHPTSKDLSFPTSSSVMVVSRAPTSLRFRIRRHIWRNRDPWYAPMSRWVCDKNLVGFCDRGT